jgi:ligand-binding sensor domain-containing protein
LSLNSITAIAEDSLGYLWLGSNNGLVRFDGLNFYPFDSNGDDPTAPYGSEIADIQVDMDGKVWVTFHEGGISIYDPTTQKFVSRIHTESDGEDFPKYAILNCSIDKDEKTLWMVSSREGVFEMDMTTLKSKKVLSSNQLRDVVYDPSDQDYIYVSGDYTLKLDKKTLSQQKISDSPLNKMIKQKEHIYGCDWSSHIYSLDLETNTNKTTATGNQYVNRALMLKDNQLWLGSFGGIQITDLASGVKSLVTRDPNDLFSIANEHVTALYSDKARRIWIGTEGGLSVIIPEYQKLTHFQSGQIDRYTDIISGESKDQYYTLSLYDNFIKEIDINTNETTSVSFNPRFSGPLKAIRSNDKIWVLFYKGFGYFSAQTKKVIKHEGGQYDALIQKQDIGDMVLGDNDYLWLYRKRSNIIFKIHSEYPGEIDTLQLSKLKPGDEIKTLHWSNTILWIGTSMGICRYDSKTGEKKWMTSDSKPGNILEDAIEYLETDNEGNLWVLSQKKGAWKCAYNPEKENLTIIKGYSLDDGLPNNRPWSIAIGSDKRIYFGSNSGLSVYSPEADRMISFNKQYGFPKLSLSPKLIDNRLFILSDGLSYFNEKDLSIVHPLPTVNIECLTLLNQKKQPAYSSEISLSYTENDVSISYISVDLSFGREITYRYRINADYSWNEVDFSQRKAVFTRLPPGAYNFEVQAAGKNMQWGPTSSLAFMISPPYWKTWWFRLISLLALLFFAKSAFQFRLKRAKRISEMKARMAELENEALRAQMNPHFIFNSLNSIKSFIINNKREEAADYLTVFSDLIRIVLNNSKKRFISLAEEKEALELYMEIENIRLEDKFSVEWNIKNSLNLQSILIPPLTIQPFVENAIWHGFVHKKKKGNLKISIGQENKMLIIKINDDGIGRVRSQEIEKKHPRKRSFGIEITGKRLDYGDIHSEVIINDLYDKNKNPIGTEVVLKMPLVSSPLEKTERI